MSPQEGWYNAFLAGQTEIPQSPAIPASNPPRQSFDTKTKVLSASSTPRLTPAVPWSPPGRPKSTCDFSGLHFYVHCSGYKRQDLLPILDVINDCGGSTVPFPSRNRPLTHVLIDLPNLLPPNYIHDINHLGLPSDRNLELDNLITMHARFQNPSATPTSRPYQTVVLRAQWVFDSARAGRRLGGAWDNYAGYEIRGNHVLQVDDSHLPTSHAGSASTASQTPQVPRSLSVSYVPRQVKSERHHSPRNIARRSFSDKPTYTWVYDTGTQQYTTIEDHKPISGTTPEVNTPSAFRRISSSQTTIPHSETPSPISSITQTAPGEARAGVSMPSLRPRLSIQIAQKTQLNREDRDFGRYWNVAHIGTSATRLPTNTVTSLLDAPHLENPCQDTLRKTSLPVETVSTSSPVEPAVKEEVLDPPESSPNSMTNGGDPENRFADVLREISLLAQGPLDTARDMGTTSSEIASAPINADDDKRDIITGEAQSPFDMGLIRSPKPSETSSSSANTRLSSPAASPAYPLDDPPVEAEKPIVLPEVAPSEMMNAREVTAGIETLSLEFAEQEDEEDEEHEEDEEDEEDGKSVNTNKENMESASGSGQSSRNESPVPEVVLPNLEEQPIITASEAVKVRARAKAEAAAAAAAAAARLDSERVSAISRSQDTMTRLSRKTLDGNASDSSDEEHEEVIKTPRMPLAKDSLKSTYADTSTSTSFPRVGRSSSRLGPQIGGSYQYEESDDEVIILGTTPRAKEVISRPHSLGRRRSSGKTRPSRHREISERRRTVPGVGIPSGLRRTSTSLNKDDRTFPLGPSNASRSSLPVSIASTSRSIISSDSIQTDQENESTQKMISQQEKPQEQQKEKFNRPIYSGCFVGQQELPLSFFVAGSGFLKNTTELLITKTGGGVLSTRDQATVIVLPLEKDIDLSTTTLETDLIELFESISEDPSRIAVSQAWINDKINHQPGKPPVLLRDYQIQLPPKGKEVGCEVTSRTKIAGKRSSLSDAEDDPRALKRTLRDSEGVTIAEEEDVGYDDASEDQKTVLKDDNHTSAFSVTNNHNDYNSDLDQLVSDDDDEEEEQPDSSSDEEMEIPSSSRNPPRSDETQRNLRRRRRMFAKVQDGDEKYVVCLRQALRRRFELNLQDPIGPFLARVRAKMPDNRDPQNFYQKYYPLFKKEGLAILSRYAPNRELWTSG